MYLPRRAGVCVYLSICLSIYLCVCIYTNVSAQAGGRGESLLLRAYTALVEGVNVVEALPPSHPSRMQSHASLLVMLQYVAKVHLVCARVCTCGMKAHGHTH